MESANKHNRHDSELLVLADMFSIKHGLPIELSLILLRAVSDAELQVIKDYFNGKNGKSASQTDTPCSRFIEKP